jgi:hypothetical protein
VLKVNHNAAPGRVCAPAVVPASPVAVQNVAEAHAVQAETPMAPGVTRSAVTESGARAPGTATVKDAMLRQLKAEYPRDNKAERVARSLIDGYLRDAQKTAVQVLRSPIELARCAEKTSLSCGVIRAAMWADVERTDNALFFVVAHPTTFKIERSETHSSKLSFVRNQETATFYDTYCGVHEATHAEGSVPDETGDTHVLTPQPMAPQARGGSSSPQRLVSIEDETWANFHTLFYQYLSTQNVENDKPDRPAGRYMTISAKHLQWDESETSLLWQAARQTTRAYLFKLAHPQSAFVTDTLRLMYRFIVSGDRDPYLDVVEPELAAVCAKDGAAFSFDALRESALEVEAYLQAQFLSEPNVTVKGVHYFPLGERLSAIEEFHARMVSAARSLSPTYGDNLRPRASLSPQDATQVEHDIRAFYALERATRTTKDSPETQKQLQEAYSRIDGKVELSWGYCALPPPRD